MDWAKTTASRDEKHFWDLLRLGGFMVNICVKIYFVNKEVARGFATKCCQPDTIQPLTPHPRTKWTSFRRRHFQMHLHEWKVLHFDLNFTEFYSQRSNWQYSSIVPESGLAPNRREAFLWTNADHPIHWPIYAALGEEVLTSQSTELVANILITHQ